MKTLTKEMQEAITPEMALDLLRKGNERFVNNLKVNRNLLEQANETSDGQHPVASKKKPVFSGFIGAGL